MCRQWMVLELKVAGRRMDSGVHRGEEERSKPSSGPGDRAVSAGYSLSAVYGRVLHLILRCWSCGTRYMLPAVSHVRKRLFLSSSDALSIQILEIGVAVGRLSVLRQYTNIIESSCPCTRWGLDSVHELAELGRSPTRPC